MELLDTDNRFKRFRISCDRCRAEKKHIKGNRVCFSQRPIESLWSLKDFYGTRVRVGSYSTLYGLYRTFSGQAVDHAKKKLMKLGGVAPEMEPDSYLEWLINSSVNICPHSIASQTTKYWIELINMCDGESGLTMPMGPVETPDIFFQALRIIRGVKTDIRRKEEKRGSKKNSHSN